MIIVQNDSFAFISFRYTIYFTKRKCNWNINELWLINLFMNIRISNWHNWSFDITKMLFLTLFHFLSRLLISKHWNSLVHSSWVEMERCEQCVFSSSKCEKKINRNIKTNCVTAFLFTDRFSSMKVYTYHNVVST